jgi:uncharacterized protein YutE (UPF0331/DUF86 family)
MVNLSLIRKKLSQIEEHIRRIKNLPQLNYEEFIKNTVVQDVFLFNITQAIQKCVDIALHIVSDEGWGIPSTQREAFEILYEKGIISQEWLNRLTKMIGFRNRIIHEYEQLDLKIIYEVYKNGIRDIEEFCLLIIECFRL